MAEGSQDQVRLMADPDGVFFVWEDGRDNGDYVRNDIFLQHINHDSDNFSFSHKYTFKCVISLHAICKSIHLGTTLKSVKAGNLLSPEEYFSRVKKCILKCINIPFEIAININVV